MRTLTSSSTGGECHNPNLGLVTKARACKDASQEEARESCLILPRVQNNTTMMMTTTSSLNIPCGTTNNEL